MTAAFIPEVNGELDTQNFEKFEEVFPLSRLTLSVPFRFPIILAYDLVFFAGV